MNPFHALFDKLYPLIRFLYERVQGHAWFTEIVPGLWLGGAPTYRRDYDFLLENGITAVVDIRAERADDLALYAQHNIDHIKLPVLDMLVPDTQQMEQAVAFTHRHIEEGGKVLIHCAKGRGRSGVLIMAYLMRYHNMSFDEAKAFTKAKRPLLKQEARHQRAAESWLAQHTTILP